MQGKKNCFGQIVKECLSPELHGDIKQYIKENTTNGLISSQ